MKLFAGAQLFALLLPLWGACDGVALLGRQRGYHDPSAPPGAETFFGGPTSPDDNGRPHFVYPLQGALLGRNVPGMNLQWRAPAAGGQAAFRLRVTSTVGSNTQSFLMYAGPGICPDGKCQLRVPDWLWLEIAGRGGQAKLVVTSSKGPGQPIWQGPALDLDFTAAPLEGDIYYMAITSFDYVGGSVVRAAINETTSRAFLNEATKPNKGQCVGCHAVSPNGRQVTVNWFETVPGEDPRPERQMSVVSIKDTARDLAEPKQGVAFAAYSPDGKRMITVFKEELSLRDAAGRLLAKMPRSVAGEPGNDVVTHPAWSPDGKTIAFVRLYKGDKPVDEPFHAGDIMITTLTDETFSPARVLVPSSKADYHYYPTFSPDGKYVAFVTGTVPGQSPHIGHPVPEGNHDPYDQQTSRLRLVATAGGTPIELARATAGTNVAATWPHFAPFQQGDRAFIVFSSKIDYGWVVEQKAVKNDRADFVGRPQLWATALDMDRVAQGDPSHAPFWLPFQTPELRNHLGVWSERPASALDCP